LNENFLFFLPYYIAVVLLFRNICTLFTKCDAVLPHQIKNHFEMKNHFPFFLLFALCICLSSCEKVQALQDCEDNAVHLVGNPTWSHNAGDDFITITLSFDKDIDKAESGFANRNGIVVYNRTSASSSAPGADVLGTITGSDKTWTFKSNSLGAAVITSATSYFEVVVEASGADGVGLKSTVGGRFDSNSDCTDGYSDLRLFHQF
jgi:hypothetical protein